MTTGAPLAASYGAIGHVAGLHAPTFGRIAQQAAPGLSHWNPRIVRDHGMSGRAEMRDTTHVTRSMSAMFKTDPMMAVAERGWW